MVKKASNPPAPEGVRPAAPPAPPEPFKVNRPCECCIQHPLGEITPEFINTLAGNSEELAKFLLKTGDIQIVHRVCEAVADNWRRFYSSC